MQTIINLNGQQLNISTATTTDGGTITVTTEKGTWVSTPYTDDENVNNDDDAARMLFSALCLPGEAEKYTTYKKWCKYMERMGDDPEEYTPEDYDEWKKLAAVWAAVCDTSIDDTLTFLTENYDI